MKPVVGCFHVLNQAQMLSSYRDSFPPPRNEEQPNAGKLSDLKMLEGIWEQCQITSNHLGLKGMDTFDTFEVFKIHDLSAPSASFLLAFSKPL